MQLHPTRQELEMKGRAKKLIGAGMIGLMVTVIAIILCGQENVWTSSSQDTANLVSRHQEFENSVNGDRGANIFVASSNVAACTSSGTQVDANSIANLQTAVANVQVAGDWVLKSLPNGKNAISISVSLRNAYAVAEDESIYRSQLQANDGGGPVWTNGWFPFGAQHHLKQISARHNPGDVDWLAGVTRENQVWVSKDGGSTFDRVLVVPNSVTPKAAIWSENFLYILGTDDRIHRVSENLQSVCSFAQHYHLVQMSAHANQIVGVNSVGWVYILHGVGFSQRPHLCHGGGARWASLTTGGVLYAVGNDGVPYKYVSGAFQSLGGSLGVQIDVHSSTRGLLLNTQGDIYRMS